MSHVLYASERDDHDYNVCDLAPDGRHEPRVALVQDPELIELDYVTLECGLCHQTTGHPVGELTGIDW